ncbi:cytochrome P450 [Mycena floridula]|nr:cytochrome P450 [Mycena floridula]
MIVTVLTYQWVLLVLAILLALFKFIGVLSTNAKLRHIPTVGPSGILSSYVGAVRFFLDGRGVVQEGYEKYKGHVFKVALIHKWYIVVSGPKMITELRKAPRHCLSFFEEIDQAKFVQQEYTMGWKNMPESSSEYPINILRSDLTNNIASKWEDIRDEITASYDAGITAGGARDWVKFSPEELFGQVVARASSRIFVGLSLCRNPGYISFILNFTMNVMANGMFISFFPSFLKPLVARLCTSAPRQAQQGLNYLESLIEERLQNVNNGLAEKPNDLLTWLVDAAPSDELNARRLSHHILTINLASIHTTTMTLVFTLQHLAAHPELILPLREEIVNIVTQHGWSKSAMGKMYKLDSLFRESLRMSVLNAIGMNRKALADFTFSDGTFIPAGSSIGAAVSATHLDEANYLDASGFKGFRFAEGKDQLVTPKIDYLPFGIGNHACPGRFFAGALMKMSMAYFLINYDLEPVDVSPPAKWFGTLSFPDTSVEFKLRARQDGNMF